MWLHNGLTLVDFYLWDISNILTEVLQGSLFSVITGHRSLLKNHKKRARSTLNALGAINFTNMPLCKPDPKQKPLKVLPEGLFNGQIISHPTDTHTRVPRDRWDMAGKMRFYRSLPEILLRHLHPHQRHIKSHHCRGVHCCRG